MPLTLDDTLATDIDEIDRQHREMFKNINRLGDAYIRGEGKEKIGRVMQLLDYFVKNHFLTEECFMVRSRYPDYKYHKAQHDEFTKGLGDLKDKIGVNDSALSAIIGTNRWLGNWYTNHISKEDMALGSFLKGMR